MTPRAIKYSARSMYFVSQGSDVEESEDYIKTQLLEFGIFLLQEVGLSLTPQQLDTAEIISKKIKELEDLKWIKE